MNTPYPAMIIKAESTFAANKNVDMDGTGKHSTKLYDVFVWVGLDLLSGTGVATALRIVQWRTLSL